MLCLFCEVAGDGKQECGGVSAECGGEGCVISDRRINGWFAEKGVWSAGV